MKGYFVPDMQLRKEKGYDVFEDIYEHNPVVFSSINNLTSSLFNPSRDSHFELVCSNPDWRQFFEPLIAYHPPERLYGQAYDLANFLEGVLRSLLIFGKAFYKIDYAKEERDQIGAGWTIKRIRWLAVETMSVIYSHGKIQEFVQQYTNSCGYKDLRGTRVEFEPDEVFFVEWVFDGEKNRGVSPLKRLTPYHKKMKWFLEFSQRKLTAMYNPKDHSYAVERARYTSWDEAKRVNDTCEMRIKDALGRILDAPMTQYYETYQCVKSRKRLASIREYLLSEFNAQVVDTISKKNTSTESARIRLVGYMSAGEIEALFGKFQNGQVSQSELLNILQNDMV